MNDDNVGACDFCQTENVERGHYPAEPAGGIMGGDVASVDLCCFCEISTGARAARFGFVPSNEQVLRDVIRIAHELVARLNPEPGTR